LRRSSTATLLPYPGGGVSIPAELTSAIRPERVHRGDPVEFREPVLTFQGIGHAEGTLFRLQNQPPSVSATAGTSDKPADEHPSPP
jgi:hypothetical protein